jgi:hypothetical protein
MELNGVDVPEEILKKLDQKDRHLTTALVCKRFCELTRSPQLNKCVKYVCDYDREFSHFGPDNKIQSLLVMLGNNKHLKKLILNDDNGLTSYKLTNKRK